MNSAIPELGMRLPTYFIAHGAGPCFFMEWNHGPRDTWDRLGTWLRNLSVGLREAPKAIVVISAHWEAAPIRINGLHRSGLLYDYGGFPAHTYQLEYPAPGSSSVASRIQQLLSESGIDSQLDDDRGLDHGVFIPLMLAFPGAHIPVVQVSLHPSLAPALHLAMGEALAPLRDEGVLLIGSGMSYHNRPGAGAESRRLADAFDAWLNHAVCVGDFKQRARQLCDWHAAPGAGQAHPREEHLLPLMVMVGAAGKEPVEATFAEKIAGIPVSCFRLGA